MHSKFDAIQLGPFASEYHGALVDAHFRSALSAFLEAVVVPQATSPFDEVQGKLSAKFDHPRHVGPNSAVRHLFNLELSLVRAGGADTAKTVLRYDPASRAFSLPKGSLYLWTEARKTRFAEEQSTIRRLCAAILEREIDSALCPRCAQPVQHSIVPDLVAIWCAGNCFEYQFHREPGTGAFLHGHFFVADPQD